MKHIRNFCIIAHIDHGKSTLADRLLERTQTIRVTEGQMLDDMDLERERGITIKSHAIQMEYQMDGETYVLNLIDTPGHVDFAYEVSRSIAACEGCLLVVDSTQGVQAQTISNLYMAIEHNLEIIPVLNKCDMPNSMPEEVEDEIIELLGCKREEIIRASGKTGEGVDELLAELSKYAVDGPPLFPDDMISDQPEKQICAELVREKLLLCLDKEIPHGTAVEVTRFSERDDGIIDMDVTIYCEKASHKGIIIGKKGAMLKKIGELARADIEAFMGTKVFLQTWVKVKENWRDSQAQLRNFGFTE